MRKFWTAAAPVAAVAAVAVHDLVQRKHAMLRNFPLLGQARFGLEAIGPELRQYLVAGNDEERPFSRDQRRWVYASAKMENNYFGFGTDNDLEYAAGYPIIIIERSAGRIPTHARRRVTRSSAFGEGSGRARGRRPPSVRSRW